MKPKHQRLVFVTVSVAFLIAATLLTLQAFRQNIVYFYSPTEITNATSMEGRNIRIGGLVKEGSLKKEGDDVVFAVTDGATAVAVHYRGMLPNLFREGQGVIAEGVMKADFHLEASSILAKHDEKYMPREVVESLKKSGRWKGGEDGGESHDR